MRIIERVFSSVVVSVFLCLPALPQQVEIGLNPASGPVACIRLPYLSGTAMYQFWKFGQVNELSNNVIMEGGFQFQLLFSPFRPLSRRVKPLLGLQYRRQVERPGNKSALFRDYFEGYGSYELVFPPGYKGIASIDQSDPESSFVHPGFVSTNSLRGQYDQAGITCGVVWTVTNLLSCQATVSYLPLISSKTLEENIGGTYNYAERAIPFFFDIMLSINLWGTD